MPATLKQRCPTVTDIPDRPLTTTETVRLWGKDRQSLGDCGRRHAALSQATEALEAQ